MNGATLSSFEPFLNSDLQSHMAKLGDIVEPRREKVSPAKFTDLPFIGMEHIEAHTMRLLGTVPAGTMRSSANRFYKGDVLYGRLRPYLNKVYRPNFEGLCSSEFIVLPKTDGIDPDYLKYRLNSHDFVSFTSHLNTGDRPRVDFDQLSSFELFLPSYLAQQRIVAEIERQFSRLDDAVANLKRVKANLKRYKAAVLKAAVEGKLTEEWRKAHPDVESANELLKRILAERRKKWEKINPGKVYREAAAPDAASLPELPEGWIWATLGQCFRVAVGATPSRKKPSYWNGNIPWVSSGEVQFSRVRSTREFISKSGLDNSSTQINPAGSVLLGMIGEGKTRGQSAILEIPAANNQNCVAIWVSETPLKPEYIYYWFMQRYEETRRIGSGNNQQALNKAIIERMSFPLPPIAEHNLIVEEIERRLSVNEEIEAGINVNLARAERFRQAILTNAFTGQLCNDESASHLKRKEITEGVA